ncbi:murein hydrolase activator EnvC family protein [Agromyces sp. NPDC058484]|uniref:murein hydrolase activator EnvC family protein n=1 Tax=Agromyces sp. NPDC058484 TaxID=3346524 RepID=UPI0036562812
MTVRPPAGAARRPCPRGHRVRAFRLLAASAVLLSTSAAFVTIAPAAAQVVGAAPVSEGPGGPLRIEQWRWPVAPPIRVVAPFRAPPSPYAAGHRGIDLVVEPGAGVVAPAAGVVSFAGQVAGRGVVAIDHGGGVVSAIEPVEALVAKGTPVSAGGTIADVASGGHCAAGCVHFGVRIDGEYVSPFLFLGGLPRAVLLPLR